MKHMKVILTALAFAGLGAWGQEKLSETKQFPAPVNEAQDRFENDVETLDKAENQKAFGTRPKNVILFIGDGMGISTVTAARIFEGQLRGESGEENQLSFEKDAYVALSKVYNTNQQTPDSAGTMTAMMTGAKTKAGVISMNQNVLLGDVSTIQGNNLITFLEMAEIAGKSTGVISTARITHATPACCYAHTPHRDWEADSTKPAEASAVADIASQLIDFPYGNGIEVAMGGGRRYFLPKEKKDPENVNQTGSRNDKRDLTQDWVNKYPNAAFVYDEAGFAAIDPSKTDHLLGLFERSHMQYEADRANDTAGEPSLSEMTQKALDILERNEKGYFLMVEAGRIDHAHHEGNAYRALMDTVALDRAVEAVKERVDLNETLIIITADHSHVFTMGGYATRGNNILGVVVENDDRGLPGNPSKDANGHHYTTLGYHNGPGYRAEASDIEPEEALDPDFHQVAAVPLGSETHSGEDVAIFAFGPGAQLFRGVVEQSYIFHVMSRALQSGISF